MTLDDLLLFFVLESKHFILLQYNNYCDFSRCSKTTLNPYEQPGETHDSIKEVKST